jgi:hypothetical protein
MMRIAGTFVLAITALAGCAGLDTSSTAQESHSWGGYHWARTSNPFTVKLGDNVTSAWDSYLSTTSTDWSKSTVLDTTIVTGQSSARRCPATVGRVEVCNNTYGNNGWLGIASIWLASGTQHITQGTVKLNDSYFNTSTYNTPAWRNLVSCQEVGHTFGLDHQDTNFNNANLGTCMDYTSDPSTNQHPNTHDYDELATIYGHTDSSTTVGLATTGTAADVDDAVTPEQWGEIVSESADGHATEYMRRDGDGNIILTHVSWVPGFEHGAAQ